ncbi:MucBP domain-containing protein [Levilactobacillus tongjiangensis]|uniref:MucBP domain-containing protein n=1 Tax=Levilactobacillus tongjiangensis TaxID=2486023 RepID=A0ABW1SQD0_9LACO|nr:MucBP domain-containing protein [Levilactobacillus tongjiangensis]
MRLTKKWLGVIGLTAVVGLGMVVQGQAASKQGKVVVYYRYNESNRHPKRMTNYSVKTLRGRIGQHYTTKAKDLLKGGGGWVLRYHSATATGKFKAKTTRVYYDYQIDSDKDYEHKGGASTYIDRTADHRLVVFVQDHKNAANTSIQRDNFKKPAYDVMYSSPNEHQTEHTYRFGKTYVYRDHEKEVYTLTLSKQGDITLQQAWTTKHGKHHVETTKVTATGKYQSYKVK